DLLEMAEALSGIKPIHLELAGQPIAVEIGHFARHRIDTEASRLATQIDGAVIHGVAQILAGIAADHQAATLHHEARERAGVAADDDIAALLVDAGARTDRALADDVTATQSCAELRTGILFDENGARQHVLAAGPADAALELHIRPIEQTHREIAAGAFDVKIEPVEDADGERVLGARILQHDGAIAALHQIAQL